MIGLIIKIWFQVSSNFLATVIFKYMTAHQMASYIIPARARQERI